MDVMLLVVMGLGTIVGLITFVAALMLGQTFLSALLLYVVVGMLASLLTGLAVYFKCSFQGQAETQPSY